MLKRRFWHPLVAVLLFVSLLCQGTGVLAGTTGGLSGTVVETGSTTPIANAKVTVTSPSQTSSTTTDAGGHFNFLSLAPDSYTVSVDKAGYDSTSLAGVTIVADQTGTVALTTKRTLQTIGRVTARSSSDIIKPGTTTDVYSVSSAQQQAAVALGGGGALNQAYSAIASVPGVFVPQGQNGIYQSVYIRGGNYTELGYEYDGVPIQRAFDQYASTTLSALGNQELQIYTGAGPADAQASGLAGFVNQVIKTGTYPGFVSAEVGVGSPTFYHKLQIEAGGASPNRNFSYYLASAGYNQDYRYASQYNGAELNPFFGTPFNMVAANCGSQNATAACYHNAAGFFGAFPVGPNGFALGPFQWGFDNSLASRESVANFHLGIPHHKDGGKDDIQFLYDNSYLLTPFQTSLNDWGASEPFVTSGNAPYGGGIAQPCGTSGVPSSAPCTIVGPATPVYFDQSIYNGPMGVAMNGTNLGQVTNYFFPSSPQGRPAFGEINSNLRDSNDNRASITKLQYQKNIGSNAYARIYGYTLYSDWMQHGPNSTVTNFAGAVSPDYELITHTRGVVGTFADQLSSHHLLNLSAGYTFANTVRWNNAWYAASQTVGVLVNAANPTNGLCYGAAPSQPSGTLNPAYCGGGGTARYVLPGAGNTQLGLQPTQSVNLSNISDFSCGGGPCEFLSAANGMRGAYNTVSPRFTNVSLDDTWKPNERININAGLHFDDFRYDLPTTTVPAGPEPQAVSGVPRVMWQNSYNLFHCVAPGSVITVGAPNNTPSGACPSGFSPAQTSVSSPPNNDYHLFEPRIGATFTVNPLNVLRASWGEFAQAASSAFQQYNNTAYNLPNTAPVTSFYPLGFFDPTHQVGPEESYNLDFSWEHQVKGSDVSFKLSPFLRKTRNELYQVLLDPKTAFVSSVNVGALTASGVEFQLRKGDFNRNGLAGQLSYTYTWATVKFGGLPGGGQVLDGTNLAVKTYNAYTSFCASNPHDNRCGSTTTGQAAGPCFAPSSSSSSGFAGSSCSAPGAFSNPYWNAPVQGLFDNGASYIAYNFLPGESDVGGASGVGSSYNIPHIVSLLLNYKHDRLSLTPALQLNAGGRYGSPVQGLGIDPASGCAPLASGAGTGNDPRYPHGGAGSAYDAQSCGGSITVPNEQTGGFDNFGAFIEPSELSASMQVSYEATKRVTLRLTGANLFTKCFGGSSEPWTQNVPYSETTGCWYTPNTTYMGNFYNPGNTAQSIVKNSYSPAFGTVFQSAYAAQVNPMQLFFSATVKL